MRKKLQNRVQNGCFFQQNMIKYYGLRAVLLQCFGNERLIGGYFMKGIIEAIEKENMRSDIPEFHVGDTVRVSVKVIEGTRERLQAFEGVVIARKNGSIRETFTVRRISFGVGVERTFPLHSPKIGGIKVVKRGAVRRAKLYYLRGLTGKAAKIKEIL